MSVDDDIFDGTVRNQIALRRYISAQVAITLALFEKYDRRLAKLIRDHHRDDMQIRSKEYRAMIKAVQELRKELIAESSMIILDSLSELVPVEFNREWALLTGLLDIIYKKPRVPPLGTILKVPFSSGASSAATFNQWVKDLQAADFKRVRDAITLAVQNSLSTNDVVAHAVGTKSEDFKDGAAAVTRNNARALVTTAIAHVSHTVREYLWVRMPEIRGAMWASILDSLTSAICRARDGKIVIIDGRAPEGAQLLQPQSARPPAHPNCRSMMVAFIDALPTRVSFAQWFKRQSKKLQEDILGVAKSEMFRKGQLTLDDFVDNSGKQFTIEQLQQGIS